MTPSSGAPQAETFLLRATRNEVEGVVDDVVRTLKENTLEGNDAMELLVDGVVDMVVRTLEENSITRSSSALESKSTGKFDLVEKPTCRFDSTAQSAVACVICQDDFKNGDKLAHMPCFHEIHSACIEQ